jgi:UDP-N-acetylmuramoyl-tripeptide--D-alanyl-D-alanine ligase
MTLDTVAATMGGMIDRAAGGRVVDGFSIDTRTIESGDLFFAIRGDRFDGHAFVPAAINAGAAGAVVSDVTAAAAPPGAPLIVVRDTLVALQQLARDVRRQSGSTVVAVTGSAGKSTTKEIAAELLSTRYRVFRNRGNLNNQIGLPLSLLELRHTPDVAVVELGMNHAGEISALVGIAEPEVRVWTNVGPAHLEFFGSIDAIADAKAEIMENAGPDDVLVANADDERVMRHAAAFAGRVRTFGIDRPADVRALAVKDLGIEGTASIIRTPAGDAELHTSLPGTANLMNVLAAAAVALRFDVPLADIVTRAAALRPLARRGDVVRCGGVTIVDDSYNSNPEALSRALAMLGTSKASGHSRRVAVIGEMLELGETSRALHHQAGRDAAQAGVSVLIAVGGVPARAVAEGAILGGVAADSVHYVATSAEAADLAAALVKAGDLVLVKGSRGIRTELVVDRLKAELW